MTATSAWAASHAEELLSPLGNRWRHVQGVTRQAQRVVAILPAGDREVLLATKARATARASHPGHPGGFGLPRMPGRAPASELQPGA